MALRGLPSAVQPLASPSPDLCIVPFPLSGATDPLAQLNATYAPATLREPPLTPVHHAQRPPPQHDSVGPALGSAGEAVATPTVAGRLGQANTFFESPCVWTLWAVVPSAGPLCRPRTLLRQDDPRPTSQSAFCPVPLPPALCTVTCCPALCEPLFRCTNVLFFALCQSASH